jgi:hypothetical protein
VRLQKPTKTRCGVLVALLSFSGAANVVQVSRAPSPRHWSLGSVCVSVRDAVLLRCATGRETTRHAGGARWYSTEKASRCWLALESCSVGVVPGDVMEWIKGGGKVSRDAGDRSMRLQTADDGSGLLVRYVYCLRDGYEGIPSSASVACLGTLASRDTGGESFEPRLFRSLVCTQR